MDKFFVINLKGEKEPFSSRKVFESARRAGASKQLAQKITNTIEREVCPGMKTSDIFKEIVRMLSQEDLKSAFKFNLKQAMRRLGPTGFPFEKYIGNIFSHLGYKVQNNQHLSGKCIQDYEIDLVAKGEKEIYIGECKYHSIGGQKVDLDVSLANYARFIDIQSNKNIKKLDLRGRELKSILITNTKFTTQAIQYSNCVGVELLGWKTPSKKGLESIIQEKGLYPITILPSFTRYFFQPFVDNKIMLAKSLLEIDLDSLSKKLSIRKDYLQPLVKEAKILLT